MKYKQINVIIVCLIAVVMLRIGMQCFTPAAVEYGTVEAVDISDEVNGIKVSGENGEAKNTGLTEESSRLERAGASGSAGEAAEAAGLEETVETETAGTGNAGSASETSGAADAGAGGTGAGGTAGTGSAGSASGTGGTAGAGSASGTGGTAGAGSASGTGGTAGAGNAGSASGTGNAASADGSAKAGEEENEYADLALANVRKYVNVRTEPNTDSEIVGKIYGGAVAHILETAGEEDDWFKIISGNVEGYIKAEFFIYGDAAAEVIDDYVTRKAVVLADRLNVREEPNIESKRIGYIDHDEKVEIQEMLDEWYKVQYIEGKSGYVAAEYVRVSEEFFYAKTLEEEAAEIAAKKALEEREKVSEEAAPENIAAVPETPAENAEAAPEGEAAPSEAAPAPSGASGDLRSAIVDYSMQFLGNRYIAGGQSLQSGTDCSGFTSLIYAQFGYSISRTPGGQLSGAGRAVSYSDAKPGDIICYGRGKCTHVALYIGNGQIIHSANSRKGVVIYNADYDNILGVRSVVD